MPKHAARSLQIPSIDLAQSPRETRSLRIHLGEQPHSSDASESATRLTIAIDDLPDNPWRSLLGEQPAPHADALEQLARFVEEAAVLDAPPELIELTGPPAACTMVTTWLRTIWLDCAAIEFRWLGNDANGNSSRSDALANAATQANNHGHADRITAGIADWWTIAAGRISDAARNGNQDQIGKAASLAPSLAIAIADAAMGLLEHAELALSGRAKLVQDRDDWRRRMRSALERCATDGHKRVALYGAGTHTRAMGDVLCSPGVKIVGIIDDDASRHGEKLWGYTIQSLEWAISQATATPRSIDAVILSANAFEPALWQRSVALRHAGVEVVRLYA